MLDIAVIQRQHAQIFEITQKVLLNDSGATDSTSAKYGVIALQFLLHSKTQAQWQLRNADAETEQATTLLLSLLLDPKRKKAQKQAIKSVCLMLRNRGIEKQPLFLKHLQQLVQRTFSAGTNTGAAMDADTENLTSGAQVSQTAESARQLALLNFLAAALQIMPGQLCCDMASAVSRLIDSSIDEKVKTTSFLTLEVLYASRRLSEYGDHIESLMRHLLENPEVPELTPAGVPSTQSNQRIIAYVQATAQIVLNYASNENDKSDLMHRQILRYVTLACSVFSEYILATSERVRSAGFSAMRLIISHGLQPRFFNIQGDQKQSQGTSNDQMMLDLLKFDALSLTAEVESTRRGQNKFKTNLRPQERLVIHMCYLLTARFESEYEKVLKLVTAFIARVGAALETNQRRDFLLVVSQLRVDRDSYEAWEDCLGQFL